MKYLEGYEAIRSPLEARYAEERFALVRLTTKRVSFHLPFPFPF